MTHVVRILRVRDRVRRSPGAVVPMLLLVVVGALIAGCSDDDDTGTTDANSGDDEQTFQTLDDAAPAESGAPVDEETALLAPGLALDPAGLDILDPDAVTTELLAFGDDQGGVIAGLEAVLGSADEIADGSAECPNGQATVATWEGTIMVDFDADEQFLSWTALPGSELTTKDDVGIGSPVSALGDVTFFEDSTLGDEFEAGGFGGLATGPGADATIDRLWAGEVCSFR